MAYIRAYKKRMKSGKVVSVRAYTQSRLKGATPAYIKSVRARLYNALNDEIDAKRNILGSKTELLRQINTKINDAVLRKRADLNKRQRQVQKFKK